MCIALLVHASLEPVPLSGVLLAAAALLVAIVRTAVSFRDVRAIAEARTQARTDDLTGLPNRRAFNELFEKALEGRDPGRPLALLIVDLDNFKDVNDTWGHHRGDELLTLVAPRLRLALREDDVLARIGGDEFAVVLDAGSAPMAADVAERLRRVLARPFALVGRELTVEASIGIAVFPDDGVDAPELLLHADSAMYAAKGAPLGYSFFHPAEHASSRQRLETVDRLRRAIERNELELHYQPQFSLAGGEVVGVEALVRWRRGEDELLAPAEFLPQAERGGLMRAVTLNVLEQAVRQVARWHAAGIDTKVGVNLSVTDLLDLEFPGRVQALLSAYRVHGRSIVLELTEDLFMADPARGQEVIARLRRTGVDIWVDDYGTGFSSLGYLRDLRDIGGLKLDRSFVTGLDTDPRARAIVKSTVALTNSLGLGLIAEGVETAGARECLVELGCVHAQGFLLSRPAPAEQCSFDALEPARRALK